MTGRIRTTRTERILLIAITICCALSLALLTLSFASAILN